MREMTVEELAALLHDAEVARADYERSLGHADPDWPRKYTEYILDQVPEARWQ
ncbi:MAG: hypothetical protein ACXWNK_04300 [Vulcanimicrobiaceae bacterium]